MSQFIYYFKNGKVNKTKTYPFINQLYGFLLLVEKKQYTNHDFKYRYSSRTSIFPFTILVKEWLLDINYDRYLFEKFGQKFLSAINCSPQIILNNEKWNTKKVDHTSPALCCNLTTLTQMALQLQKIRTRKCTENGALSVCCS